MKINNKDTLPYIIVFSIFLLIHIVIINNSFFTIGDDMNFRKMALNYNFFDFVSTRYNEWTGRIIIEGSLYSMVKEDSLILVWKIVSVILYSVYVVSVFLIVKTLSSGKIKTGYQCFIIFLIATWPYILYYATFNQGITWFTGSFNYFFPFAFACVVLLFIVKKICDEPIGKWFYGFVIISAIYASNQEQLSLVLTTLMLLLTGYLYFTRRIVNTSWLIILFILVIGLIVLYIAPGNEVRLTFEAKRFKEVSFIDVPPLYKLMLGIEYTVYYYLLKSPILLALLSIPLLSITLVRKNFSLAFGCLVMLVYFSMASYLSTVTSPLIGNFEPIWKEIEGRTLSYEASVLFFILSAVFALIPYCIFLCFESKQIGALVAVLFVGGIFTGFILGFSPTIIASGFRIFFVSEMLLVIIVASIYLEFFRISKSKLLTLIVCVISFIIITVYALDNIKEALEPFSVRYF